MRVGIGHALTVSSAFFDVILPVVVDCAGTGIIAHTNRVRIFNLGTVYYTGAV
jgi:hypothetical protein